VRAAYLALVGRCLPREIKVEDGGPLLVIRDYTESRRVERIAGAEAAPALRAVQA
jgi:hypothetical protein